MEAVSRFPTDERPDFRDPDDVRRAVFNMYANVFLTAEAERKKLHESKRYEETVTAFRETMMASKMRLLVLEGIPEPSEEDLYAYYDSNQAEFASPKRFKVREIQVPGKAMAESLRVVIDAGDDFETIASAITTRPGYRPRGGDLGFFEPFEFPVIFRECETMNVGQVKGPVQTGERDWSIIKLEEIRPSRMLPIEEVTLQVASAIRRERQSGALNAWLDQRRVETTIEVDYELLWKIIDKDEYES